ncbi:MAG: tetratricopeptide repeat protein, partial [Candidatus Marinimicrobia bacterium]|nr:tetratricopeptide repeat protein [Candidatus Neomarinimicrobiota bacterium]
MNQRSIFPDASSSSTPHHNLAAIMFTDIAGFTEAMSVNEEHALNLIHRQRSILNPLINENSGTFVKEIGDGTLSCFHSAIDAANCAVKLQQAIYEDSDLNIRIGVHCGQVLFEKKDVFGDVVNVAARLESIAPVGGICVSKSVFDELLDKNGFDGVSLGLQQLKGVGRLIDVFALKAEKLKQPDLKEYENNKVKPHLDEEVPSVAVLPLKNKGKEEDAFYAYGITTDLITDLSSAGKIRVASMKDVETIEMENLSVAETALKLNVRYIVSGMLWKHEDVFQLSIEMVDSKGHAVIWSDRWQERWEDLANIKAKLTENLLKVLNLSPGESGITKTFQTNAEAYEYYLKGKYKYGKRQNLEDMEVVRGLFQKALELDADLVLARIALGDTYIDVGDYKVALQLLFESLEVTKTTHNQTGQGSALISIGNIHAMRGNYEEALKFYEQSLLIHREISSRSKEENTLINIGNIHASRGEFDEALNFYEQSLVICRELDDRMSEGRIFGNIGNIHADRGDYDEALKFYEQSLVFSRELDDRGVEGGTLGNIGVIYINRGNYDKALIYFRQSLEINRELGDRRREGATLNNIGVIHQRIGDYDEAMKFYEQSLEIVCEIGNQRVEGDSLNNIGNINSLRGEYDEALKFYEQSLEISQEIEDHYGEGNTLSNIGILHYRKSDYKKAIKDLEKSLALQKELDLEQGELFSNTTYLFLSYKQIGQKFDTKAIQTLLSETDNVEYEDNFRIFELLADNSYLETAYKQVLGKANGL